MASGTYSGNPSSTPKDAVRFLSGDTGPSFTFSDEEILYLINSQANEYMAAASLCDKMTTLISGGGLASKSIGGLSESYSSGSVAQYSQQARLLRIRGTMHQVPSIATISQKFSFRQFDGQGGSPRLRGDDQVIIHDEEQTE